MKTLFRHYHQYNEEEFKSLWKDCIFVFDTNVLLNLYRYSRETSNEYLNVLKELSKKKKLWIPYQVGLEFHENRLKVILEYEKSYDELIKSFENIRIDITDHPFLDLEEIKTDYNKATSDIINKIKQYKAKHPNWLAKDEILESLKEIFDNNIGENYSEEELKVICSKGSDRYDKKIPPGFNDRKKSDDNKYGDLIIWFQIIKKAQSAKKPIIFISNDLKDDWWLELHGKTIMPLPQLKKEIKLEAEVDFHIYNADNFLKKYKEFTKSKIDDKVVLEVQKIRESNKEDHIMNEFISDSENLDILSTNNSIINRRRLSGMKMKVMLNSILEEMSRVNNILTRTEISDKIYVYSRRCLDVLHYIVNSEDKMQRELINTLSHLIDRMLNISEEELHLYRENEKINKDKLDLYIRLVETLRMIRNNTDMLTEYLKMPEYLERRILQNK